MRKPTLLLVLGVLLCLAGDGPTGVVHLFTEKGPQPGWVVGQVKDLSKPGGPDAKWFVNEQGILTGSKTYDTWLMSEKEYGDFELELEFKVSVLGNSGIAIRARLHGDPAYEGMELQIVDPRYYEGRGVPEQLCGAIYRAIAPRKQVFKPEDWNKYQISCIGPHIKVVLNGEVVQDYNLDEQTQVTHRDKPELTALPLKDRPRKGHIGFQELCRDGGHSEFRNVMLRVLDKEEAPPAK